jgi:outer membrane protein assembly factor BamB
LAKDVSWIPESLWLSWWAFLLAVVAVGCGSGPGKSDGRDGERGADATNEETTAPEADRSAAKTTQEPVGLDVKVVSPGKGYMPAGFGEGSLWATNPETCEACAGPGKMLLKRLDPRSGEEVQAIPLKGFFAEITEVAFGAGSVWISRGVCLSGPVYGKQPKDVVLRVDPETNRVVDRIPVYCSSGLAFGHGSVWVTSVSYGIVSRIDPQTGEVVTKIEVGRGAVDIATAESSGAVWVAGLYLPKDYSGRDSPEYSEDRKLTRIDPETNRVVAQIPIEADSPDGGASSVAVGEGEVWAQSVDGKLYKVDPAPNEIVAKVSLGDSSSHLAVYGGAVWATFQFYCDVKGDSEASVAPGRPPGCTKSWSAYDQEHLVRVDPRKEQVVASADIGPIEKVDFGRLVAGGGYVWFASGDGLARVAP